MKRTHAVTLGLSMVVLGGCALLSKGETSVPQYFSPDLPRATSGGETKRSEVELRLGRVTAGSHLGERMVFRESEFEVGFYDDRLWTERPVAYLRRAIGKALFEQEGLRSVLSGNSPTLDVELLNFEEVKGTKHIAMVRLAFSLHDHRVVRMQRTLAVERPIRASDPTLAPSALAEALGEALRTAVDEVAGLVVSDLTSAGPSPSGDAGH